MNKKTRRKVLLTSLLAIVCCMSLIAGATFALFTSESQVNIAVTSGKVNVVAAVSDLKLYSATESDDGDLTDEYGYKYVYEYQTSGTFKNGGTATLSGNEITLSKLTPGDKVSFNIKVINNDNVLAKYRTYAKCVSGPALFQGLNIFIKDSGFNPLSEKMTGYNAYSDWDVLDVPAPEGAVAKTVEVIIEFPITAGNQYQELSTKIVYGVEAIQGNAHTEDYSTVEYIFYDNMNEGIVGTAKASEEDPEKGVVTLQDDFAAVITTVPNANIGEDYKLKAVVSESPTAKTFTLQGVNSTNPEKPLEQITYDIKVLDKDDNVVEHDTEDIDVKLYAGLDLDYVAVFHHVDNGAGGFETIQVAGMADYNPEDGYVRFNTGSFSDYTVVKSFAPVVIVDEELNVKLYSSIQEAIDDAENNAEIVINYLLDPEEEVVIDKPVVVKTAENGIKDEDGNVVSPVVNNEGNKIVNVKDVEFVVSPELDDVVFDIDVETDQEEKHCEEHDFVSEIKDGYVTYTCVECGFSYTKKFDTESTCTHQGTLTHLSWVDKEVSCTEGANEFVRCGDCQSVIINYVEPIGHDFGDGNTCINRCNGEVCGVGSFMVGEAYFTTLQEAVLAANDGGTVKLINPEFKGSGVIAGVENVVIDLNGNSWLSTGYAFTLYDCNNVRIQNGTIESSKVAFRIGYHQSTIVKWKDNNYGNFTKIYGHHPLAPAKNVALDGLDVTAENVFYYTNIEDDLTRADETNPFDQDLYGRYIYKTGYQTSEQSLQRKYDEVFTECTDKDSVFIESGNYVSTGNMTGKMYDINNNRYTDVLQVIDGTYSSDGLARYIPENKYLVGEIVDGKKVFTVKDEAPVSYVAKVANVYYCYEGGGNDAIAFADLTLCDKDKVVLKQGETVYLNESSNQSKVLGRYESLFVEYGFEEIEWTGAEPSSDEYSIIKIFDEGQPLFVEFTTKFNATAIVYKTSDTRHPEYITDSTPYQEYGTLQEAFAEATTGNVVRLMKDVTLEKSGSYNNCDYGIFYGGQTLFDLNGHILTYTGTGAALLTSTKSGSSNKETIIADLSVEQTGTIHATQGYCFGKKNKNTEAVSFKGGNYISDNSFAIWTDNCNSLTIDSGYFEGKEYWIAGTSNITTLNINGGTFSPSKEAQQAAAASCLAAGSLITMADGSKKKVEDLTLDDKVLAFDHLTGQVVEASIPFIEADGVKEYSVVNLLWSNGQTTRIIGEHGFFDLDLMQYVYLRLDNVAGFVGHRFSTGTYDGENFVSGSVVLEKATITTETVGCYSFPTVKHLDFFTEDMLSMPGGITGMFNIFTYDDDLTYNAEEMAFDIETFGLYTYENLQDVMTYEEFCCYPSEYVLISMGKGLMDSDQLDYLIERYVLNFRAE